MTDFKLHIEQIKHLKDIPFDLLLLADPSLIQIHEYLKTGTCYVAKMDAKTVGALVLYSIDFTQTEVKNIAVKAEVQGKGIGKALLNYAEIISRKLGFKKLIIGTGNSSIDQLAFYQKQGFEICGIEKNFFLENYAEPIYENGIQCKHKIVLNKEL